MLAGGWQMSTIFRYSSGLPLYFRSGFCNVPGAFRAACIPGITNAGSVFAQDKGSFDPAKGPLFNKDAFEPVSAFNFYYGKGNRVEESQRAFGYHNQDLSFIKNTTDGAAARTCSSASRSSTSGTGTCSRNPGEWGGLAFNNDLASPDFGKWNGSVTEPRTMQLAARIEF